MGVGAGGWVGVVREEVVGEEGGKKGEGRGEKGVDEGGREEEG